MSNLPVQEDGLPKLVVDWAQVGGAILGALALAFAVVAWLRAPRDLSQERRRLHELEVLRDVGVVVGVLEKLELKREDIQSAEVEPLSALETHLKMLPNGDFPLTRAALGIAATEESKKLYSHEVAKLPEYEGYRKRIASGGFSSIGPIGAIYDNDVQEQELLLRIIALRDIPPGNILRRELDAAIDRRMA